MIEKNKLQYIAAGVLMTATAVFFVILTGFAAEGALAVTRSNIVFSDRTNIVAAGTPSDAPGGGYEEEEPGDISPSPGTEPVVLKAFPNEDRYTTACPGMPFDELAKIECEWFFPNADDLDFDEARECSIEWDREAYESGMASGHSSFRLTGTPGPEFLSDEDLLLWERGLLYVEKPSFPVLIVKVVQKQPLPFRVELAEVGDDEYWAWFYFPTPHGASSVILEASIDGRHWYTQEESVGNEFMNEEIKTYMMLRDEADQPLMRPSERKPYYFRIQVYGSAYEGQTAVLTVGEKQPPKDNDDIDGNRGGVQADNEKRFPTEPAADVNETEALQLPAESLESDAVFIVQGEESKAERTGQKVHASKHDVFKHDNDSNTLSEISPDETFSLRQKESSAWIAETAEAETKDVKNISDAETDKELSGAQEASSPPAQRKKIHIPGFAVAFIGTGILLACGTAVVRLRKKRSTTEKEDDR